MLLLRLHREFCNESVWTDLQVVWNFEGGLFSLDLSVFGDFRVACSKFLDMYRNRKIEEKGFFTDLEFSDRPFERKILLKLLVSIHFLLSNQTKTQVL